MGLFNIYISALNLAGTAYQGFEDVTPFVDRQSFSSISQKLDNSEFDIGVFRFSNFSIGVRNETGKFSPPSVSQSMFPHKRADSIVKVTWKSSDDPVCGVALAGESKIATEIEVYRGLLDDQAASTKINTQKLTFTVLGLESIFSKTLINSADVNIGDKLSEAIFQVLDQKDVTDIMTLDAADISISVDETLDDVSGFDDEMTVKEALDELLKLANAILYIREGVIFVRNRTATEDVKQVFFGESSIEGIENIVDLFDIKEGLNKMFNQFRWGQSVLKDAASIALNRVRKKEFESDAVTDPVKRQNILAGYLSEFSSPKRSMTLRTPITYETLKLLFLDKIAIDYPPIAIAEEGELAVYGLSEYSKAFYPTQVYSLTLNPNQDFFKIMGIRIDTKFENLDFSLREV